MHKLNVCTDIGTHLETGNESSHVFAINFEGILVLTRFRYFKSDESAAISSVVTDILLLYLHFICLGISRVDSKPMGHGKTAMLSVLTKSFARNYQNDTG